MKRMLRKVIGLLLALLPMAAAGQEVVTDHGLMKPETGTLDYRTMTADTLRLEVDPVFRVPEQTREMPVTRGGYDVTSAAQSGAAFRLWKGAMLGVYGATDHMPGLMDINSGTLALYQNLGRLNLSLSANANKYWLPMQSTLLTQYGFSGHVSYDAASWITLHAFGNYYIEDLRLPPAISPYAYSTSFGGYADVRFSDHWGANLGAQRYLNPLNGRWETEPIVSPYYKFNNGSKLELPLGHLLKEMIWGREQPTPMMMRPMPKP